MGDAEHSRQVGPLHSTSMKFLFSQEIKIFHDTADFGLIQISGLQWTRSDGGQIRIYENRPDLEIEISNWLRKLADNIDSCKEITEQLSSPKL